MRFYKPSLILIILFCSILINTNNLFAQQGKIKNEYVYLFMGTAGDNGQVDPAACVPYGMARVCPDSDPRTHVGYDYDVNKISGFSVNRISGIGCSGAGGNLSIKPVAKDVSISMNKELESATPGYYTTTLTNGIKAELTATHNVAIERYLYPKGKAQKMSINFASSFTRVLGCDYEIISDREIQGYIHAGNTCDHGAYKLYFNISISKPFTVNAKHEQDVELAFEGTDNQPIEVRVALSPISTETARLENEGIKSLSFEQIKSQASNAWENILSRIEIKGAGEDEKKLFYTSLYRVFLSPANTTSIDGKYLATNGEVQQKNDYTYYSCWSMWDTYRTKFPLITLLDSKSMRDIANSLCNLYIYGKKDWATDFESTPTVRTEHSQVVLLDAYKKGITNINLAEAYDGIKKEMDNLPTNRPDQTLESCIDWWAMAQIAEILNKTDDANYYSDKAKSTFIKTWNTDFNNIDDSFTKMRGSGLYQGTRWQYRWALPQYLNEMADSAGGQDILAKQLTYFFDNNLFNQGNEPGIHAPYIFNRLQQYDKAQANVRRIIKEDLNHLYGGNAEYPTPYHGKPFKTEPKGYMPEMDEDDGTMSAWYVFSTIGLYPLVVGEPWYEIVSPLYDNITIQLDNGKKLNITTKNRKSPDAIIRQVKYNGKIISDFRINHNDILKGGTLELEYK